MDEREEQQLLEWYEESTDDDLISASEHDPYSDNGEFGGDADYVPSASSSNDSDERDNLLPDETVEADVPENDEELALEENQIPEQDMNENDNWEEVTSI